MQSRNMARLVIERIYLRGRAKRVVCFESCGGGKEVRVRHPDLYPSPCASQGNRVIPILPTKPRPFEDQQRTVNDAEEDALILWRNSGRVSTAVGGVSRDGIEISSTALFVLSRTRGPRVPTGGFVCLRSRLPSRQRSAVATTARGEIALRGGRSGCAAAAGFVFFAGAAGAGVVAADFGEFALGDLEFDFRRGGRLGLLRLAAGGGFRI